MASDNPDERPVISDEQYEKIVKEVTDNASKEVKEGVDAFVDAVFKKGMPAKDALGLKPEMIEGLYGQAYRMYNNGKYQEASMLFRLLILLNVTEPKYTMGLASSMHMMKLYDAAAQVYAICGVLDPENPIPYYHASDCWMHLNEPTSALISLEMAVNAAGDQEQYKPLKDRCLMTINTLTEELKKKGVFKEEADLKEFKSDEPKKKKKKKKKKVSKEAE